MLPLLAAALWHARSGMEPRGLAVIVDDDEAAHGLAESAAPFLPEAAVAYLPSRGAAYGSGPRPGCRTWSASAPGAGGAGRGRAGGGVGRRAGRARDAARPPAAAGRAGARRRARLRRTGRAAGGGRLQRVDTVEERGTFSVRGGLVDVFPTTGREPVRVELFGDEVERLSAVLGLHPALAARSATRRRSTRPPSRTEPEQRWGGRRTASRRSRAGLVALTPELERLAQVLAWNPDRRQPPRPRGRRRGRPTTCATPTCAAAAICAAGGRASSSSDRGALSDCRSGSRTRSTPSIRRWPSFGIAEAENELRAWSGPATGCWSASRIWARPSAPGWRCAGSRWRRRAPGAAGPAEPGVAFVVRPPCARGLVDRPGGWRCCPSAQLFRRARAPACRSRSGGRWPVRRPAARRLRRPRGSRRRPLRPLRHQRGGGRHARLPLPRVPRRRPPVRPHEQLGKVRRYVGADGARRRCPSSAARPGTPQVARAGGGARAGRRAARAVRRAARPPPGRRSRARRRVDGAAGGGVPVRGDRRPAARIDAVNDDMEASSRWTGWSAATSASARPRSPCGRP